MKILLISLILVLFNNFIYSQDKGAVSLKSGAISLNKKTYFGPGASFQVEFFKNFSGCVNLDYNFGPSKSRMFHFDIKVDYYLIKNFNGPHIGILGGGYFSNQDIVARPQDSLSIIINTIGFGVPEYNSAGALGINIGYAKELSEKIFLDLSNSFDFVMTSSGDELLAIRPVLSLGYKFK